MRCNIPSRDLGQKLNDTVCRYKGEPVYVRVDRATIFLYKLTNTGDSFAKIKANDPDFDIASLPLGYCQYGTKVYYITRSPDRRVKQGFDIRSMRYTPLFGTAKPGNGHGIMFQQGFVDMVMNKYPDLSTTLKTLRAKEPSDETNEMATSRDIALSINKMGIMNVHFKNDFVGWMQPEKNIVHVPQSDMSWVISKYLSHELEWKVD